MQKPAHTCITRQILRGWARPPVPNSLQSGPERPNPFLTSLSNPCPKRVSTELISETNKENQVCEERGFAPFCLKFGHPAQWTPHCQQVGAPSVTLTFPAPPAPVPAAPESASLPCSFRFSPAAPQVPPTPASAHGGRLRYATPARSDARRGGAAGAEGAGKASKCPAGQLPSLRAGRRDGRR